MRSVADKGNKQWAWLALDVITREIVGCHIGDRSKDCALALLQSMPAMYRLCAMIHTDHWEAYKAVLPSNRHCFPHHLLKKTTYNFILEALF